MPSYRQIKYTLEHFRTVVISYYIFRYRNCLSNNAQNITKTVIIGRLAFKRNIFTKSCNTVSSLLLLILRNVKLRKYH